MSGRLYIGILNTLVCLVSVIKPRCNGTVVHLLHVGQG